MKFVQLKESSFLDMQCVKKKKTFSQTVPVYHTYKTVIQTNAFSPNRGKIQFNLKSYAVCTHANQT